jgi:hypothetical protein
MNARVFGAGVTGVLAALAIGLACGTSAAADDCPVPVPAPLPCPLAPSSSPTPSESPTVTPTASPAPVETATTEPQPTETAVPVLPPVPVVPEPAVPVSVPVGIPVAPEVAQTPTATQPVLVASVFPSSLSGPFAILVAGLLGTSLLITVLATAGRASAAGNRARRRRLGGLASAVLAMAAEAGQLPVTPTAPTGGPRMSETRRWRLYTGIGLLLASAVVGLVGWYKVSGEPALNFEMSVVFSAGVAAMILAVAGGALLVAEQMRTDDTRLDDMEDAIRSLVIAMAPSIERPARLREEPAAPAKRTRRST